jgi:Ni,Fe-hydrogenase maturation factor
LVLGIGNSQAGDDAFGPAVLRALAEETSAEGLAAGVELADGGILGIDLLSELDEIARLILVDAIRPAGTSAADRPDGALEEMGKRGREPAAGAAAHWGARPDPVPGEVVVFRLGEVELADPDPRFSLHDLSFGGCLRLAKLLGLRLPEIHVVGLVLPAAAPPASEGEPLSAAALRAVPEAARAVRSLLPR